MQVQRRHRGSWYIFAFQSRLLKRMFPRILNLDPCSGLVKVLVLLPLDLGLWNILSFPKVIDLDLVHMCQTPNIHSIHHGLTS